MITITTNAADEPASAPSRAPRRPSRKRRRLLLALCLAVATFCALAAEGIARYREFYDHTTAQEASRAVEHRTFDASLRGQPFALHIYRQQSAQAQPLVLFTSGDGGWSPFCADIAAHIADGGRTVVGFDAKTYLTLFAPSQKPVTPEELAADYRELLDAALSQPGVDARAPAALAGWSLGAGFSVLAANDPVLRARIDRVVAVSLPRLNELAWKPTDALIYITHGTPHEKVFDVSDYLARRSPVPLFMLNATDDEDAPLGDAQRLFARAANPKRFFAVAAQGHHFEQGQDEFYRDLDESLRAATPVSTP